MAGKTFNPKHPKNMFCIPSTPNDGFKTGFTEVTVFKKPQQTRTLQENKQTNNKPTPKTTAKKLQP